MTVKNNTRNIKRTYQVLERAFVDLTDVAKNTDLLGIVSLALMKEPNGDYSVMIVPGAVGTELLQQVLEAALKSVQKVNGGKKSSFIIHPEQETIQ